jgi:1-phosphatidylinositol-3-phosphate 5-kinase
MASNNYPNQSLTASPVSTASILGFRTRRDSLNSVSVTSQVDKEQLAHTLDKIHTSASQSDALTTFNDFAPPPASAPATESRGIAGDLVQNGFTGLYTKFKEVVGAVSSTRTQGSEDADGADTGPKSGSTAYGASKASVNPLPRGDTSATMSTFHSTGSSDGPFTGVSSSGVVTAMTDSQSQAPQSSKATSISALSVSKASSSSRQSLPNVTKASTPTAVDPTVATGIVHIDSSRSVARPDDGAGRTSGRRSISKVDGHPLNSASDPNVYEVKDLKGSVGSARTRRDDAISVDGSTDMPTSPMKNIAPLLPNIQTTDLRTSSSSSLLVAPRIPSIIDRISGSKSPGYAGSRTSSVEHGTAEASPISTSAHNSVYHDSFAHDDQPRQMRSGALRIPGTTANEGAPEQVNARLESMRKQVLSKEFWMADETCKECFLCGQAFTAFRRKHHCRTCGCIFDSKCTSIISGQKFGVPGSLRVCKTCLDVINRRYDGSGSDDSADESYLPAIFRPNQPKPVVSTAAANRVGSGELHFPQKADELDDVRSITTPMMAIAATRRIGDPNRTSAVLEIDAPQLSRPSSSRSLKSLASGRPQSSGHKRHHSRGANFLGRFKATTEDPAPFRKGLNDEMAKKPKFLAFHDDNIIDPELAAYMSDESSGDEQMSIFATMAENDLHSTSFDPDKASFAPFLATGRRHRHRGEKSISGVSFTSRGLDDAMGPGSLISHGRPSRRRNLSTVSASVHHLRSPRPKSGIFKGPSASNESVFNLENSAIETSRLYRSDSMRDDKPVAIELHPSNMRHVKKLLSQLLEDAEIPNAAAWEKALVPILLQCTDDVTPDVRNGDDMDIRHFLKVKKIPGAKPGETTYVSGVVFTKKLALKSMPRSIINPRIVIVSFPIEYQRHQQQQQFMSLQSLMEQEKEFLRVVVNRIINLRPQVLLAEKSVSGVALQYLSEANIAVAYNVKPEVLDAVSRCAETDIISSLDMLALPVIRVGRSAGFDVKTYVNNDFPGKKKTYIFISGCSENLGCTIALRGASTSVLAKMKKITEFMVYVVYNLKLETCLMRDEYTRLPPELEESHTPASTSRQHTDESLHLLTSSGELAGNGPAVVINAATDSEPTTQTNLSTPTTATTTDETSFPDESEATPMPLDPPNLISLHESHSYASHDSMVPEDVPMPTFYSDMVAKYQTKILSASPLVKFTQPYLLMKAREQERRLEYLKRLRDQDVFEEQSTTEKAKTQKFQLIKPEMVHTIGQKAPRQIMEILHAVHDAEYDKALYTYQTQTRQWENYIQGNLDLFDPYSHQNIVALYSVVCTETKIPCTEPGLIAISFYDEQVDAHGIMDADCTLGQYIEYLCLRKDSLCLSNGCDRTMVEHHRTYVHDESRVTIFVEPAQSNGRPASQQSDDITMWSYCKTCKRDTPVLPMSDSTWKYSFGKYLELLFWSKRRQLNDKQNCPHFHHQDHIRYFEFQGARIRVHCDSIDLLEIIVPRARITWKVEHDLKLKNDTFTKIEERWTRFISSVKARIKNIRLDSVLPEKADDCKTEIERLFKKAQEDQNTLIRRLQDTYVNSRYYEAVPFNIVIREMLEVVGEWDAAFTKFEADFLPDKDLRQITMIQLKKMFTDESKESLPTTEGSIATTDTADSQSQTFSEADEKTTTQPTDCTDSAMTESTISSKPGEVNVLEGDAATATTPAEALQRVEPLDLTTPTSPTSSLKSPLVPETTAEASDLPITEEETPPVSPIRPTVLAGTSESNVGGPSLSEKVEQLRREHLALSGETSGIEHHAEPSKAAPERVSSRRAGLNVAPPMIRTLSQPIRTIPRGQSVVGKAAITKDNRSVATDASSDIPPDSSVKVDKKLAERLGLGGLKSHRKAGQSSIPRFVHKKKESKVSTLAKHFEQLSREFERERIREDRKKRAARLPRAFLPRTSTKATVEVYDNVNEAVQEPGPLDDDSIDKTPGDTKTIATGTITEITSTVPSTPVTNSEAQTPIEAPSQADEALAGGETDDATTTTSVSHAGSDDEGEGSDGEQSIGDFLPEVKEMADSLEPSAEMPLELPKHQKLSLMNMLTNFWAERSASGWTPLEYPINDTDHIFIDSDIIVREDEPSSLVAFALGSEDYKAKLADIRHQWQLAIQKDYEGIEGEPKSSTESEMGDFMVDEGELEKSLLRATGTHLKYQFSEGAAKMLCKIFYAEQFDALRRKCGVADRIVESLSRCLKWDSKGGKTKSVFLKTLDDRLVLKVCHEFRLHSILNANLILVPLAHRNRRIPSFCARLLWYHG